MGEDLQVVEIQPYLLQPLESAQTHRCCAVEQRTTTQLIQE